jgi:phosphoglycolate phosphatase-like HAD superfamily hydrolase
MSGSGTLQAVMFDVDGTLLQSSDFDGRCYVEAVRETTGRAPHAEWQRYTHVSDAGILDQHVRELGLEKRRDEIHAEVKARFVAKIAARLAGNRLQAVPGAAGFVDRLRRHEGIVLSIATGGWRQTAAMKLESAGIDIRGIPIASSDDHYARTEIMKIARTRAAGERAIRCTYFGDADWDRMACETLGYDFVLVGDGGADERCIADYNDAERAMACLGL